MDITIKIITTERGPDGKMADAELIFGANAGLLAGLRLVGFSVWRRRTGGYSVTVPARQYTVNGERRSYMLLRPMDGSANLPDDLRDTIITAYMEHEAGETDEPKPKPAPERAPAVYVDTITDNAVTARLAAAVRMF